jgi:hypothetical protein
MGLLVWLLECSIPDISAGGPALVFNQTLDPLINQSQSDARCCSVVVHKKGGACLRGPKNVLD